MLPLVESFFVLADARVAHMPIPDGLASRGSVQEMSRESSVPMELVQAVPTEVPEAAASRLAHEPSSGSVERQALDVHMPFLRYVHSHLTTVGHAVCSCMRCYLVLATMERQSMWWIFMQRSSCVHPDTMHFNVTQKWATSHIMRHSMEP